MIYFMLLPILFPILAGVYLLVRKEMKNRQSLLIVTGVSLAVTSLLGVLSIVLAGGEMLLLFNLTQSLPIIFKIDNMGAIFAGMTIIVYFKDDRQ